MIGVTLYIYIHKYTYTYTYTHLLAVSSHIHQHPQQGVKNRRVVLVILAHGLKEIDVYRIAAQPYAVV